MSTEVNLGSYVTITDVVQEYANGNLTHFANTLTRQNDILEDAAYTEANQMYTHKGMQDGVLPTPSFKMMNYGTPSTAPKGRPVLDGVAIMEDWGEVDYEVYRGQPNSDQWRQRQDGKHVEGMSQAAANALFYASIADDPASFNGLTVRYNSTTTYPNGDSTWEYNVQDNGGTGSDTMSMWVIEWDQDECCMLYPTGSQGGLEFENLGKQVSWDSNARKMMVLRTHFLWKFGLFVSDERRVQRIANIETTGADYTFDENKLIDAIMRLPSGGKNKSAIKIYTNMTGMSQMWKRLKDKNNVYLTVQNGLDAGGPVLYFNGYPLRRCDTMRKTETAI